MIIYGRHSTLFCRAHHRLASSMRAISSARDASRLQTLCWSALSMSGLLRILLKDVGRYSSESLSHRQWGTWRTIWDSFGAVISTQWQVFFNINAPLYLIHQQRVLEHHEHELSVSRRAVRSVMGSGKIWAKYARALVITRRHQSPTTVINTRKLGTWRKWRKRYYRW